MAHWALMLFCILNLRLCVIGQQSMSSELLLQSTYQLDEIQNFEKFDWIQSVVFTLTKKISHFNATALIGVRQLHPKAYWSKSNILGSSTRSSR